MTFKAKLAFFYLLNFGTMVVLAIFFCLKWYSIGWLFYIGVLLYQRFIYLFPKDYKNIYRSKLVNTCLIIFSIMALALAVINVVLVNTNQFSLSLEKVNNYGLIAAFAFLIPVAVMSIREQIKSAINVDKETRSQAEV